ncbi:unnamed protein product, partial [Mesorhabditis spiculigera]
MALNRARGALMGQFVGDALGSRYEFGSREETIQKLDTDMAETGELAMLGGGCFNLPPGTITDDSEMALSLSGVLLAQNRFDQASTAVAYARVLTTLLSNVAKWNDESQSNGCLMRISPLPVFYWRRPFEEWAPYIAEDVALTHCHPVPAVLCEIYCRAIHLLINGESVENVYRTLLESTNNNVARIHLEAAAVQRTPVRYGPSMEVSTDGDKAAMGYSGLAFQIAFHELLHARTFSEGLLNSIRVGGDTDTNGCITAALLGARFGELAIPASWREAVQRANLRMKHENGISTIGDMLQRLTTTAPPE